MTYPGARSVRQSLFMTNTPRDPANSPAQRATAGGAVAPGPLHARAIGPLNAIERVAITFQRLAKLVTPQPDRMSGVNRANSSATSRWNASGLELRSSSMSWERLGFLQCGIGHCRARRLRDPVESAAPSSDSQSKSYGISMSVLASIPNILSEGN